jgi:2-keto-4-pentenoate hydratase
MILKGGLDGKVVGSSLRKQFESEVFSTSSDMVTGEGTALGPNRAFLGSVLLSWLGGSEERIFTTCIGEKSSKKYYFIHIVNKFH